MPGGTSVLKLNGFANGAKIKNTKTPIELPHDATTALLVSQNKEMAAILVHQNILQELNSFLSRRCYFLEDQYLLTYLVL